MPRTPRTIIVANRLPVRRVGSGRGARWESSAGGLVTAMTPVLERAPGSWIGWTGAAETTARRVVLRGGLRAAAADAPVDDDRPRTRPLTLRTVPLSAAEITAFYHGMSNRTLWPLYHDAIRTPEFNRAWWRSYVRVNQRFARAAAAEAKPGDMLWVHDYHLQLVPRMVRRLRPGVRIGFFLHVPFPPEELFDWLPWRAAILEGLLGADLIGFQTHSGARNFAHLARAHTPAEGTDAELRVGAHEVRVGAFPISIDFAWWEARAMSPENLRKAAEIRKRVGIDRVILLAVDRLDYTKGIDIRLRAWEELLRDGAVDVDRAVLVQIAVPSREVVSDYAKLRGRIEQTVGRINGQFSEPGRVAVHYFRRNLSREELSAYYRAADVMLVTPLRDGMNLVAKEFIATRTDLSGVLVLSEFAGAARELRRALLVNPRDLDRMKAVIMEAIRMPTREGRLRMAILRTVVRRHDVHDWAEKFVAALAG